MIRCMIYFDKRHEVSRWVKVQTTIFNITVQRIVGLSLTDRFCVTVFAFWGVNWEGNFNTSIVLLSRQRTFRDAYKSWQLSNQVQSWINDLQDSCNQTSTFFSFCGGRKKKLGFDFLHFMLNWPLPNGAFQGKVKNPNWQKEDQLAMFKRSRGVEQRTSWKKSSLWSERDLNSGSPVQCPNDSATLPAINLSASRAGSTIYFFF